MKPSQSSASIVGFPAVFSPATEGGYVVTYPDFPGAVTEGDTFEEARANATELLSLWIEELTASHQPIPRRSGRPIIDEIEISLAG